MSENKKNTKRKTTKKVSNKKEVKKTDKTEIILKVVFTFLVVFVTILSIVVFRENKKEENIKSDFVMPIIQKEEEIEIKVNLKELQNKKLYKLKITNYKGNSINSEEIPYEITIKNDTDTKINLVRVPEEKNLIVNDKLTKLEGLKTKAKEREDVSYHITIKGKNKISEDDEISIIISS